MVKNGIYIIIQWEFQKAITMSNFKKILISILFLQFESTIGQNLKKFDSITFNYSYSTSGSKKNKYENEKIKIIKNNYKYLINNKEVDSTLLNNLWLELNQNKDNFTFEYFTSKKMILKNSKIKKHIKFYNKILKSENQKINSYLKDSLITDIKNYKSFYEFIEFEKPKKDAIYGKLDHSEEIEIIFYNNEEIIFEFETFHNCGQPFYLGEKQIKNKLVNLEINQLILNILPKKSKFRSKFNYNNIQDKYVNWFIKEKLKKLNLLPTF